MLKMIRTEARTMNKLQERWIEYHGSVFLERQEKILSAWGVTHMRQHAIAFNVGREVANHMVRLHNHILINPIPTEVPEWLRKKEEE